jgi:MFS family permease
MSGVASRRWLIWGTAVNSLGSGAYLPISLVLLTRVSGLALTTVGLLVTVTSLVSLAAMPYGGGLIDRVGARSVQRAAHMARAVGFLAYPVAHSLLAFASVALVVAVADRVSRVAQPALIASVATGEDRDRYLALNRSLTNAGLGLGGVAVTLLLMLDGRTPYVLVSCFNALSFATAALFVALLQVQVPDATSTTFVKAAASPYRTILSHQRFRQLTTANACSAFGYSALSMLIPLYAMKTLHTPSAFAGALFTLNTVLCAIGGVPVTSWITRRSIARSVAARGGLVLMTLAFVLMAVAAFMPSMPIVMSFMVAALVVYTLGELAHSPSSTAQALSVATDAERGRYMAVYQASWALAACLAPALFTTLIAARALVALALLSLLNGVAVLLLTRAHRLEIRQAKVPPTLTKTGGTA